MKNLVESLIQYENAELNEKDTINLFQHLVNEGLCWKLQGHYGRTAKQMIDAGMVELAGTTDLEFVD